MAVEIVRHLADLRARVAGWRASGARVAVVPTMGALHEGHLSLVAAAAARAERVIVTLFVNPRQFDSDEDYAAYPRTEQQDAARLAGTAAELLYVPGPLEIYPHGFATTISVAGLTEGLCGATRPGHFAGMTTVVAKLFTQTSADIAMFGEKDFQQLRVVQRLARDLDLPIEVIGCATLREPDGLAMSSRNTRLSAAARAVAPALFAALCRVASGEASLDQARQAMLDVGYERVEYLELRADDDLVPLATATRPARLLVAAWLDGVRLIDNVPVSA